jgi:hypothetical protein
MNVALRLKTGIMIMVVDPNMVGSVIGASASMLAITVALLALVPTLLGMITGDRGAFFEQVFARQRAKLVMALLVAIVLGFGLAMVAGILFFFVTCQSVKTITGVISAASFVLATVITCVIAIWFIIKSYTATEH